MEDRISVVNEGDGNTVIEPPPLNDVEAIHREALDRFEADGENEEPVEVDDVEPDDSPDVDDVEAAADDTDEVVEDEPNGNTLDDSWDGQEDTLPDTMRPTWKKMQAAHTKRSMELSDERKQLAALMEEIDKRDGEVRVAEKAAVDAADVEPTMPAQDSDQATWTEYWRVHQMWSAREANRKQGGTDPRLDGLVERDQVNQRINDVNNLLMEQEGFDNNVAEVMARLTQEQPLLQRVMWDNDGALHIMSLAKQEIAAKAAAEKAATDTRKKAKSSKGKVSRPSSSRGARPKAELKEMTDDDLHAEARRMSGIS